MLKKKTHKEFKKMYCKICGAPTLKPYYKLCLTHWKSNQPSLEKSHVSRFYISQLEEKIVDLEEENDNLNYQVELLQQNAINLDLLKKLRLLCHPDKHGGSDLSNTVTKQLNEMIKDAEN